MASFLYFDSLEKPVLDPIYAPDGEIVTRGYPIYPRANEPTDHPHHVGLWFNYENVNGIDFWNNSSSLRKERKSEFGWIREDSIIQQKNGNPGSFTFTAYWEDAKRNRLLKEITLFVFYAYPDKFIIDRITRLVALQDVSFPDAKDGMLGLRVTHELELPFKEPRQYIDDKGNITTVQPNANTVTGNYLTSEGKEGDSAWGTRAKWCLMYGKKNNDTLSIAIIDHPDNIGYPTYWHARGYGLFAANPIGKKIFSNGREESNFKLKKGEDKIFRFRIVIASGKNRLQNDDINKLAHEFK